MRVPNGAHPMQFHSREEHESALHDACMLIVSTWNETFILSNVFPLDLGKSGPMSAYDFMRAARAVADHIANKHSEGA